MDENPETRRQLESQGAWPPASFGTARSGAEGSFRR